jgi:signal transduction histidine kinase/ligand-binding sensor domain-containing protein
MLGAGGASAPVRGQALPPLDEYLVRAYGPGVGGMTVSNVRGLAQTSNGYLYVAQARGLVRYNGYGFDEVALPDVRSEVMVALHVDRSDRLWVLTNGNDVGYVEHGSFHLLPAPPAPVLRFWETPDGLMWLGGLAGLLRVKPEAQPGYHHFTTANGLPDNHIFGVFDLPEGHRIVVTFRGAVRMETDAVGGVRFIPWGPPCELFGDVRHDARGLWRFCASGQNGYYTLRFHEGRFTRYQGRRGTLHLDDFGLSGELARFHEGGPARDVEFLARGWSSHSVPQRLLAYAMQARDSTRWLVVAEQTNGRQDLVRQTRAGLETIALRTHFDFRQILHLREDHEGSIWVGTDRGLFQLSRRKIFALTQHHGLGEGFTVPVLQTRDGAVWLGTWGGGLHRFVAGKLDGHFAVSNGLPASHIRALWQAADGTLWVGTAEGFAAIRAGRVVESQRLTDEVRAFAVTHASRSDTTLWIGTTNQLLRRTRAVQSEYRPGFWQGRQIWALHTDRAGALWIGAERGLFQLIGDSLRSFGEADGLGSDFIVAIHEEPDGTLWFSSYEHGLYRYRNGRFAALTTREGLHANGIWRMLEDGMGGVWLSSDVGIARVQHARLHAVADAVERGTVPAAPLRPLVFTEAEGTPSRESNRASPGGWRLQDGRLLFNNLVGAVVIDPRSTAEQPRPPATVVEAVLEDGRAIGPQPGRPATVTAGTKQLSFGFAALSFVTPEQNRYRYRLDGYDETWVEAGTLRRASYTNLPPGRYTFRVQGASATSEWSEPGAVYSFVLTPSLWQSVSLRLAVAVVFVLLAAAAYRYRVTRLLELQRLRLRIASDLHDDVGSNLSSIALLSDMLQGQSRLNDLEQRQLQRINQAAEETIGALRDIIWLVDPKHDDLKDLLHKMRSVAGDLLNGTSHNFAAAEPAHQRPLSMAFMRNTLLIYKEVLHNVARHADASHVSIEIGNGDGMFVLRIRDDGIGFDEARIQPGRGLESMRRRAQHTGGKLEVTSAPGRGTQISFSAKIA